MRLVRQRWRLIVWSGYTLLLATSTHLPPDTVNQFSFKLWDKLEHTLAYAGLGVLTGWAATSARRQPFIRALLQWTVAIAVFAALDELTQPWVGRDCDLRDWCADVLGALVGLSTGCLLARRTRIMPAATD